MGAIHSKHTRGPDLQQAAIELPFTLKGFFSIKTPAFKGAWHKQAPSSSSNDWLGKGFHNTVHIPQKQCGFPTLTGKP